MLCCLLVFLSTMFSTDTASSCSVLSSARLHWLSSVSHWMFLQPPDSFTMVKAVRMSMPVLITAIKGDLVTLSICLGVTVRDKRTVKQQKVVKDTKDMLMDMNVELIMPQSAPWQKQSNEFCDRWLQQLSKQKNAIVHITTSSNEFQTLYRYIKTSHINEKYPRIQSDTILT